MLISHAHFQCLARVKGFVRAQGGSYRAYVARELGLDAVTRVRLERSGVPDAALLATLRRWAHAPADALESLPPATAATLRSRL